MLRGLRPLEVHFRCKAEVNFSPLEQRDRRRALLAGCVFWEMCVKRTECPRFAEHGSSRPPAIGDLRENSFEFAGPVERSAATFF